MSPASGWMHRRFWTIEDRIMPTPIHNDQDHQFALQEGAAPSRTPRLLCALSGKVGHPPPAGSLPEYSRPSRYLRHPTPPLWAPHRHTVRILAV